MVLGFVISRLSEFGFYRESSGDPKGFKLRDMIRSAFWKALWLRCREWMGGWGGREKGGGRTGAGPGRRALAWEPTGLGG